MKQNLSGNGVLPQKHSKEQETGKRQKTITQSKNNQSLILIRYLLYPLSEWKEKPLGEIKRKQKILKRSHRVRASLKGFREGKG